MKRTLLMVSLVLIVVGFVTARIGDSLSTVTESGRVQDSILMPIGAIGAVLGLLGLIVSIGWYLFTFIRNRVKKS